jgi:hypothetical protein
MSQVRVPAFGVCPWRSPVLPPKERKVYDPNAGAPEPESILGPCIQAACGVWKITKMKEENGQMIPVEGMCGIRFLGEVMNSVAGSLENLVRMQFRKSADAGEEIFGGEGKSAQG